MAQHLCGLCLDPVQVFNVVKGEKNSLQMGRGRIGVQHSNNDCSQLEDEIIVVFIVRKLLSIPTNTCEELLKSFGSPSNWLATCCVCSEVVRKARIIQQKINILEKELQQSRDEVRRKMVASYGSGQGHKLNKSYTTTGAALAIRNSFLSEQAASTMASGDDEEPSIKQECDVEHHDDTKDALPMDVCKDEKVPEEIPENDDVEWSNAEAINTHDENSEYEDAISKKRIIKKTRRRLLLSRSRLASPKDGQVFNCSHCSSRFTTHSKLAAHLRRNHWVYQNRASGSSKKYSKGRKCSDCNQHFKTLDTFRQHCIENHAMFPCTKCPRLFTSFSTLSSHNTRLHLSKTSDKKNTTSVTGAMFSVKSFAIGEVEIYQCLHCNFCNQKKCHVYTHMRSVHWSLYLPSENSTGKELAQGSGNFQCDKCPSEEKIRFPSINDLNNHKVSAHGMVKCDKCSSVYIGVGYLENHQQLYHSTETADPNAWLNKMKTSQPTTERSKNRKKLPQCKFCQETFKTRTELSQHNLRVHSSEMIKCDKCPRIFESLRPLYFHKTEDHNEPNNPYKCSQCDYSNRDYKQIHRHVQAMHEKRTRVICELCSESFSCERYLKYHKVQKHGHQPTGVNVYCGQCNKTFSTPAYLKRHIKTAHLGEWRFKCPICDIGFMGQKQVDHHINIVHKNNKPFTCPKEGCEWKYALQWQLNRHMKGSHAEGPILKCSKCDYETCDSGKLKRHEANHNTGLFQCELCGKSYTIYKCFLQHLRMTHKIRKVRGRPATLSPFVASITADRGNKSESVQKVDDDHLLQITNDTGNVDIPSVKSSGAK